MKKYKFSKGFICGLVTGSLVMASVPVFAENITAIVDNTVKLLIAGEFKTLPEGYSLLNYNGRTYLPSRYVAEELGATVQWDESSRIITITPPPPKVEIKEVEVPVEVEKIVYVEKSSSSSSSSSSEYKSLPLSSSKDNIVITLRTLNNLSYASQTNALSRLTCDIENLNSYTNIGVDYSSAVLEAKGVEYKTVSVPANAWDAKLMYEDVPMNKTVSGFLAFPLIDKDATDFTLRLPVRTQATGEITEFEIKFRTTLND